MGELKHVFFQLIESEREKKRKKWYPTLGLFRFFLFFVTRQKKNRKKCFKIQKIFSLKANFFSTYRAEYRFHRKEKSYLNKNFRVEDMENSNASGKKAIASRCIESIVASSSFSIPRWLNDRKYFEYEKKVLFSKRKDGHRWKTFS